MKIYGSSICTGGEYYTHGPPQIFYGLRRTPHDQLITYTRGRTRTCVYAQRLKRFITRNFSSQLNRILKTEPVQNKNRFCRIRYSKMDIPTAATNNLSKRPFFLARNLCPLFYFVAMSWSRTTGESVKG